MLRRSIPTNRRPERQPPGEPDPNRQRAAARWRSSRGIMAAGLGIMVVGAALILVPWYQAVQWQATPEAASAQRNLAAPTPIWITPGAAQGTARAIATTAADAQADGQTPLAPTPANRPALPIAPPAATQTVPASDAATPVPPTPTLEPSALELRSTEFTFLDPPEPGAAARLHVLVGNPTDEPGGPITLAVPLTWLAGYAIQATDPATAEGSPPTGERDQGQLRLTFDGPAAQSELGIDLDFVATAEVIDPPLVSAFDGLGRPFGSSQPPTQAPTPRAGPVWSITIPRLDLATGVVQVDWEPPLFVVGQLRTSAHVTEGNTVLVGHVRGAAGYNVFDHLDRLAIGDTIVASSRGVAYQFVVDRTDVRPESDTSPTEPTTTPRLTLMTCAGDWNPLTRDYSDRLWVIAEPPDAAAAAIAAQKAAPSPTPLVDTAATATAVAARRLASMQVSPAGGLGNTDTDLARAFGPPRGESPGKLAVYPAQGQRPEQRAQLVDVPDASTRRAVLVASVPPSGSPLAFEDAVRLSRGLMPGDAQPRAARPEGNARFVVERFNSPSLASVLPDDWFADRQSQPGDFVVVYDRRADGRIAAVAAGIGDDPQALLAALDDV